MPSQVALVTHQDLSATPILTLTPTATTTATAVCHSFNIILYTCSRSYTYVHKIPVICVVTLNWMCLPYITITNTIILLLQEAGCFVSRKHIFLRQTTRDNNSWAGWLKSNASCIARCICVSWATCCTDYGVFWWSLWQVATSFSIVHWHNYILCLPESQRLIECWAQIL